MNYFQSALIRKRTFDQFQRMLGKMSFDDFERVVEASAKNRGQKPPVFFDEKKKFTFVPGVLLRGRFQHGILFGHLRDIMSEARSPKKKLGGFLSFETFRIDDPQDPFYSTYLYLPSAPRHKRFEVRQQLKRLLGAHRKLVHSARAVDLKTFESLINPEQRWAIRKIGFKSVADFYGAARSSVLPGFLAKGQEKLPIPGD